jgi:hypothetical protein
MRAALMRRVEARAARRRATIAAALAEVGAEAGVDVAIDGEVVRVSARGLRARWWRDLALREAGRTGA